MLVMVDVPHQTRLKQEVQKFDHGMAKSDTNRKKRGRDDSSLNTIYFHSSKEFQGSGDAFARPSPKETQYTVGRTVNVLGTESSTVSTD